MDLIRAKNVVKQEYEHKKQAVEVTEALLTKNQRSLNNCTSANRARELTQYIDWNKGGVQRAREELAAFKKEMGI